MNKAKSSPCIDCVRQGDDDYPHCVSQCEPVNRYLKDLGDIPHKPKNKNLHLLNPPTSQKNRPHPICHFGRCTPEQFAEAVGAVQAYFKAKGGTIKGIAEEIGINNTLADVILGKRRDRQKKQLSTKNYEIIKQWMGKE